MMKAKSIMIGGSIRQKEKPPVILAAYIIDANL